MFSSTLLHEIGKSIRNLYASTINSTKSNPIHELNLSAPKTTKSDVRPALLIWLIVVAIDYILRSVMNVSALIVSEKVSAAESSPNCRYRPTQTLTEIVQMRSGIFNCKMDEIRGI